MPLSPDKRLSFYFEETYTQDAIDIGRNAFLGYSTRNTPQAYDDIYVRAALDYGAYMRLPPFHAHALDDLTQISVARCLLAFPALDLADVRDMPKDIFALHDLYITQIKTLGYQGKTSLFDDLLPKIPLHPEIRHALTFLGATAFRAGLDIYASDTPPLHSAILDSALNYRGKGAGMKPDDLRLHLALKTLQDVPAGEPIGMGWDDAQKPKNARFPGQTSHSKPSFS